MLYKKKLPIAGIFLYAFSNHAISVEDTLSEDDFFHELPVVLSVSRLEQPLVESPSAVTIIDREMIEASGAREVAELFRFVPGFQVGYFKKNIPVVTYHGLSEQFSRRMQVLINGRSVYTPAFGGAPWADLTIGVDDIERIEVIRGPNAALYGSNSFSAVISITTRNAAGTNETTANISRGDNGINDQYFNYWDTVGDLEYSIRFSSQDDTGFENVHDNKRSSTISGYLDYQFTSADNLIFETGFIEGIRETGEADATLEVEREKDVENFFMRFEWQHTTADHSDLSLQYYYNRHDIQDVNDVEVDLTEFGLPVTALAIAGTSIEAERHDLELEYIPATTGNTRYVVGGSIRLDQATSNTIFNTPEKQEIELLRLFANVEHRFTPKLLLNAGAMFEDHEISGKDVSPKATLLYKLDDEQAFRFTISKAFRTPVLFEDRANTLLQLELPAPFNTTLIQPVIVSDGQLKPEEITSYEIGYQAYRNDHDSTLNIKIFKEKIKGLISQIEITDLTTLANQFSDFANGDNVLIKGLESSLDYRFSKNTRFIAGVSRIDIDSEDINDQFSMSIPENSLFFMLHFNFRNNLNLSIHRHRYDDFTWLDSSKVFDVDKMDIHIQKKFKAGNTNAYISLVLHDILDEYIEYRIQNVVDTGGYLKFGINF